MTGGSWITAATPRSRVHSGRKIKRTPKETGILTKSKTKEDGSEMNQVKGTPSLRAAHIGGSSSLYVLLKLLVEFRNKQCGFSSISEKPFNAAFNRT